MAASPTPIPGAPAYASAEVMANNAYNAALAQLNQNRLNTLTQYGYTGNVDPSTGVLSGVRVDPNAIHGQLQDLLHNQAVEDMQAAQGAQDRHLVGGLAHQAGSELRFQHSGQDTQFGQGLAQQLSDYQGQQQQAAEVRDAALWQAEQDAANQATSDQESQTIDQLIAALGDPNAVKPDSNPAPQSGGGGSGGGGSGKPGKGGGRVGSGGNHPGRWTKANRAAKLRAQRRILRRGGGGGRSARSS